MYHICISVFVVWCLVVCELWLMVCGVAVIPNGGVGGVSCWHRLWSEVGVDCGVLTRLFGWRVRHGRYWIFACVNPSAVLCAS